MFTERRGLRRRMTAFAVVMAVGVGMQQAAVPVRADDAGSREDVARAIWSAAAGDARLRYEFEGRRITDPDGSRRTFGFIATDRCLPRDAAPAPTCIGSAALKKVKDHLDMNATLSQAAFLMHFARIHHKATWDGTTGAPAVRISELQEGQVAVARGAEAAGSIFGNDVDEAGVEEASLQSGVQVSAEDPPPAPRLPGFGRSTLASSSTCWDRKIAERGFVRAINRARMSRELRRLRFDPELSKAARVHTREMIRQTLLHHTPSDTLRRRVTRWVLLGENVGVGASVSSLHAAFMASPSHRANILLPRYNYVGVGTAGGGGRLWVTVIFERRKNPGTRLGMPRC